MSVRSIEAEVSIKSGVQAECTIGRGVVVEVHDDINLEALTATENGSYRPESGVDGWDRVTVVVPERQPVTEPLSVTANGQYAPAEGVDGFSGVTVAVPERIPVTESLSVTENGTYEPTEGIDGYDRVTVAVPPTIPDIEPLTITANGVYTAESDGYNPVTVQVPERVPITESLTVTANGTYTPTSGVDGFDSVTVDVPSSPPTGMQFTLIGQSTHTLAEYTDTSTAETINTGIDVTNDDHAFLFVVITCDGTPAVENAWGGVYMDIATRYTSTSRVLTSNGGVVETGTKSMLLSEASGLGGSTSNGPIHVVNNVPTVRFIRRASSNGRTVMAGTYTVKVYGIDSL